MNLARVPFDFAFFRDSISISRRAALWRLADVVSRARPSCGRRELAEALYARERLGTTAIGGGVALPHSVLKESDLPLIVVQVLHNAVNFDAPDARPVDVLVAVVGEPIDLRWLQAAMPRLSKLGSEPEMIQELRAASDAQEASRAILDLGIPLAPLPAACALAQMDGVAR